MILPVVAALIAGLALWALSLHSDRTALQHTAATLSSEAVLADSRLDELQAELQKRAEAEPLARYLTAGFDIYKRFDLPAEDFQWINLGNCSGHPCYTFGAKLHRDKTGNPLYVAFWLGGEGLKAMHPKMQGFGKPLPIRRGCEFTLPTPAETFVFRIEDDRVNRLQVGVIVRDTENPATEFPSISGCEDS